MKKSVKIPSIYYWYVLASYNPKTVSKYMSWKMKTAIDN